MLAELAWLVAYDQSEALRGPSARYCARSAAAASFQAVLAAPSRPRRSAKAETLGA